ncbi:MAG: DNA repair protein RecO [Gammaproteobacteria bacterium]|nr:MAG: DNA repair protein RecO [Gammaproteobacteria bacterium]
MTASRRMHNEPAWLLHHRPFRDSSQILDILSRDHGRLAVVAKGSRGAKSRLRGILRPFLPLQLSWVIRSDLGTLTGAEMDGAPITLTGDALLSGYYVNELILKLLHRHDPQPEIFAAYSRTIEHLAGNQDVAPTLRQFEIELLRLLGYALNLDHDTATREPLMPQQQYEYRAEQGPVPVDDREGPMVFTGAELMAIRHQQFADPAVLKNAGSLLRIVIAHHLDGKELKSRKVMQEIRKAKTEKGRKGN